MRSCVTRIMIVLAAALAFAAVARAQTEDGQAGQQPGTGRGRGRGRGEASAPSPTANLPFDPRDFSGVWMGRGGAFNTLSKEAPPMTAWGKARYDAARPGIGPRAQPLGNDPIMACDPIGYPRIAFYNAYPMEFVQTKDRLIEFFDFFYTYRTIYLDGRKLADDPEPTWYGYSVGHWDGDYTLVVNTAGVDDSTWLDRRGYPHSADMRVEERFTRVNHDLLEVTVTVDDPKFYTKPFALATSRFRWIPNQDDEEQLCVPSEAIEYRKMVVVPAGQDQALGKK